MVRFAPNTPLTTTSIVREYCDRMFNIISYSIEIILFRERNTFLYFATTAGLKGVIKARNHK